MNTLSVTITLLAHSLCWALLYSLWQGLFIYIALSFVFKSIPALNTRVKYFLSYASFSGLFIWFIGTWVAHYNSLRQATAYTLSFSNNPAADIHNITRASQPITATAMWHDMAQQMALYFPYIIALYVVGLVFMSGRFIINILRVQHLGKDTVPAAILRQEFVDEWQHRLGIRKAVHICLSNRITVPVMIGAIKPIILLPVVAISQLSTQELEAIILHELAHIKRHDYLLNIFQIIGETILFFNPFIWLISAVIRREREHCCDDLVVACYRDPLPYARALATLENNRVQSQLSLAATGHQNRLFNRIKRIMEMKTNKISYSQFAIIMAVFITIAFAITLLSFTPSFAQKATQAGKDSTITKSRTVCKTITKTTDNNGNTIVRKKQIITDDNNAANNNNDDNDNDDVADDDTGTYKKVHAHYEANSEDYMDMKNVMEEVQKATKEATEALANSGYKEEVEKAMKEAQQQINNVDWEQVKANIDKGMEEINKQLNNEQFKKSVDEQVRQSLEESKKALEEATHEINKNMEHKEGMIRNQNRNLSDHSSNAEEMIAEMKKDGLINGKHYSITKDGDALYINGKKQPQDVCNKYRKYLDNDDMVMDTNQLTLHANKMTISQ
ncbi:MAG TPA: M56 family metallopeptidase [Candidatus Babeliaceae bacterium]|nr:M56 family metallopeptidase [Candidatus Babeliaceae bacterium]